MSLEDDDKKPTNPFPVLCGFAIGSMPIMLHLPIIGKLLAWLLGHVYFFIFYLFMVYLPFMIGNILARIIGFQYMPTLFCVIYWVVLGALVGTPKHAKKAWFYILVAHVFIPMVFLLNAIRSFDMEELSFNGLFNLLQAFSGMLGQ